MASLKEIKNRISSVNSTLKITSAMKMVASAKLRVAQKAIGNMVPYQSMLRGILVNLLNDKRKDGDKARRAETASAFTAGREKISSVALICFSSNTSLCGAFNANAIRAAVAAVKEYRDAGIGVTVYSVGRKMADAMKKIGCPSPHDYVPLSASPNYAGAAELAQEVLDGYVSGRFDKVELIYNHFKSTSSQPTVRETYLPLSMEDARAAAVIGHQSTVLCDASTPSSSVDYILEPGKDELLEILLPKVELLKVYTVLLDTGAAEHAARTVAMQMATDNGNDLLAELTLEYNKGRQQKITNELLDIASGSVQ